MELVNQLEILKKAVSLCEENTDAIIRFAVNGDELCDHYEHSWTSHEAFRVEIESWMMWNDRIITDESEAVEEYAESICEGMKVNGSTDGEIEKAAEAFVEKNMQTAIVIYTRAATDKEPS